LSTACFVGAALSLFEQRGENSGERNEKGDDEENEAHGAPKRSVTRRARLVCDVGKRNATREQPKQGK